MHRLFEETEEDSAISPVLEEEPSPAASASDAKTPAGHVSEEYGSSRSEQILRFQKSERMLHWSIAVPFMACYATGMVLMLFYNLHSPGISRQVLSWFHRIGGAALIFFPVLTILRHWRDYRIHLYNTKHAWHWAPDDLKWLVLMIPAAVSRRITTPEQGKFNAAEKLNFLMVLCTCPLFIATGLLIWMPERVVLFWLVHVGLALVATPLMLGHIYMALVNPGTRLGLSGMISGYVDRHWAAHHYRRWYRENFEGDARDTGESKQAFSECRQKAIVVVRFVTTHRFRSDRPIGIFVQAVPPAEQDKTERMRAKGGGR